jgi:membrane-associated phospholipid phosphatase
MAAVPHDDLVMKAADYVSMATVSVFVFPIARWAETGDWRFAAMALGAVLADGATKLVKIATRGSTVAAFKRPPGARDCDFFCRNGDCAGRPGFPSGHATLVAFFFVYLYLLSGRMYGVLYLCVAIAAIAAVCAARIVKRCHTLLQVVVGTLWGAAAAFLWDWTVRVVVARG